MGGGSSQPTTTTQIQKVELPAWVDQASQENYNFAKDVADRPFQNYPGQLVAGQTGLEKAAGSMLMDGYGDGGRLNSTAAGLIQNAGNYTPQQVSGMGGYLSVNQPQAAADVSAKRFDGADLAGYLNPYTNNVVDTTLSGMRDNLALSSQKADDAARGAGAYGSSRSGVMQAVLQSQGAKDMAATEAGLRSAAYTDAAGRLQADNTSALQAALANQNSALQTSQQRLGAQTANQSAFGTAQSQNLAQQTANQNAGLAGAQLGLSAGTALGDRADATVNNAGKTAIAASQLGAQERSINQAGLDAQAAQWQAAYDAPLTALNTRLAALGMSPYGKTTSTTETKQGGTSSNTGMQVLGGAMSLLPLLFGSDERLKKNVKTVGTTESGAPLKEFEYKGFMGKSAPGKKVGVMAQDMEKVRPDAVHRFEGPDGKSYRAVDYAKVGRGFMGRKRAA